jgi:hypothetical protein
MSLLSILQLNTHQKNEKSKCLKKIRLIWQKKAGVFVTAPYGSVLHHAECELLQLFQMEKKKKVLQPSNVGYRARACAWLRSDE